MKRNTIVLISLLAGSSLLTACGSAAQDNREAPINTSTPSPISYTNEVKEKEQFNFTRFELDVDYVDSLSYEVEYNKDTSGVQASIEDLDNQKVMDKEAFNQLAPHFQEMSFDSDTPSAEVVNEVLRIFGLDETFREFDLEVTFKDGKEKDYQM